MKTTGSTSLLALALLLTAATGGAAPTGNDVAVRKADELFREARALMAQSRFAEACPKLVESQRLDAGVGTLLTLGECYEANGELPAAAGAFAEAEQEATHRRDTRSKLARERLTRVLPKVGTVRLLLQSGNMEAGAAIAMDGVPVESSSVGKSLYVAPGAHLIVVGADGKRTWSVTVAVEAAVAVLDVLIPELETEAALSIQPSSVESTTDAAKSPAVGPSTGLGSSTSVSAAEVIQDSAASRWSRTQWLAAIAVGGLGLVGTGVGSWLLVSAQSKEAEAGKFCNAEDQSRCTQKGVDLIEDAKGLDTAGGVVLGVGIAGLLVGTILYITEPSLGRRSQKAGMVWQPLLLPSTAGVTFAGRY